ncbi:MAG TPA: glycoside hydrolase family 38 C-terminal domain-containing protein, partial [Chroococcidiopsis sp.]
PTQSAQNSDPRDRAQWEVPALQWADLTGGSLERDIPEDSAAKLSGVSLLNDCKHGYDAQPSQLRLTLLRSSHWPHANADKGMHQFTYALYPHAGSWQAAQTARHAYELNQPLLVRLREPRTARSPLPSNSDTVPQLPAAAQLLRSPASNLFPMALKRSEDDPQRWMWRFYEGHGEAVEVAIADFAIAGLDSATAQPTSLLEGSSSDSIEGRSLSIAPWKITTLAFTALPAKP